MHNSQLDDIDKKILDYLVENTRMPFTEIAQKMGVSAGTIHVRVNGRCRNHPRFFSRDRLY